MKTVTIQPVETKDAEEIFALVHKSRAHLNAWLPWVKDTKGAGDTLAYIQSVRRSPDKNKIFTIRLDGEIRGMCGLTHICDENRSANLGYWIAEDAQKQNLATSAVQLLVEYGFKTWLLHRITITCAKSNFRSARVAEKAGFELEGTAQEAIHLHGQFHDALVYAKISTQEVTLAEWISAITTK